MTWVTQSEQNSDYFEVERSIDGGVFTSFATVKAAGNSVNILNYSAVDYNPYYPNTIYRLKQVDQDGSYKYSNMILIEANYQSDLSIHQVYPNPTTEEANVQFSMLKADQVSVEVTDMKGYIVYSGSVSAKNENVVTLNCKTWSDGIYIIRIVNSQGASTSARFVKN